ncbi:hypothetical protein JW979_05510 [bacterium]|nr:hypothetical protein [candidate division CSSED10-310 bacterium]
MNITRNVILDLLPLYAADEVSEDTRILIEKYLETDTELTHIAHQMKHQLTANDIPVPLKREDKMEAYLEAKRIMLKRTIIWASVTAFAILSCLSLAALAFFNLLRFAS